MKNIVHRHLHQIVSDTKVVEYNKHNKDSNSRQKICITDYSPIEYEELVFLQPSDFKEIFGEEDRNRKNKYLPIVKITNPRNGEHVYRLFRKSNEIHGFEKYAGVSFSAINKITDNSDEFETLDIVLLSKGSRIPFYWCHPNHATKIAVRMGVISIALGIISICWAIIQFLNNLLTGSTFA